MPPSKWQKEFHIRPEERLLSRKPPFFLFEKPLKYLGALAGVILGTGLIGYIISYHSSPSLPDHLLPIVKAPEKPFKIKPALPESEQQTLKHKTIYEKLATRQPDEKVEHLLKEPEEPLALPPSLSEEFVENLMEGEDIETLPKAPESASNKKETEGQKADNSVEKQAPLVVSGTSVKTKKDYRAASAASSDKGTHWVQLASLKTREAVEREWKRLSALSKLKPLLKNLKPVYGRVDMGETEGIRYRLRVGLFSYEEAKTLCRKLKEKKVDCMVKKG